MPALPMPAPGVAPPPFPPPAVQRPIDAVGAFGLALAQFGFECLIYLPLGLFPAPWLRAHVPWVLSVTSGGTALLVFWASAEGGGNTRRALVQLFRVKGGQGAGTYLKYGVIQLAVMALVTLLCYFEHWLFNAWNAPARSAEGGLCSWNIWNLAVATPLVEEFLFRGVILRRLLLQYSVAFSILFSSLVFAALHLDLFGFIPIFVLGTYFSVTYYLTRNLWICIICHAINNAVVYWVLALGQGAAAARCELRVFLNLDV